MGEELAMEVNQTQTPSLFSSTFVPVLQIVHVTDLHVKATTANPVAALAQGTRLRARFAQRLQRHDWFGWEEGTQGHLFKAPGAFKRFLKSWWADHPKWQNVPVWLVDTGDRTAFGDVPSIEAGGEMLQTWSEALDGCPIRSLYGNHDMWPQTLPLLNRGEVSAQRKRVRSIEGWDVPKWLTEPLSAPIPGHKNATIDLYALDSVACGSVLGAAKNTLAVGQILGQDLLHFRMLLEGYARRGGTGLRILALHHPLAFPWLHNETSTYGGLPTMKLLNDHKVGAHLRNDLGLPKDIGPWAHLMLSGHTHMIHPGPGLNGDVTSLTQGPLSAFQAQLVGSSLMLNRDSRSRRGGAPTVEERDVRGFAPSSIYPHPCHAHILRFYASSDPSEPWLQMLRIPVYSQDAGRHYVVGEPDDLLLHYR